MTVLTLKKERLTFNTVAAGISLLEGETAVYLQKQIDSTKEERVLCSLYSKELKEFRPIGYLLKESLPKGLAILSDVDYEELVKLSLVDKKITEANLSIENIHQVDIYVDVTDLEDLDEKIEQAKHSVKELIFESSGKLIEIIKELLLNNNKILIEGDVHENALYLTDEDNEILATHKLTIETRYLLSAIKDDTQFSIVGFNQSLDSLFKDKYQLIINLYI